MSDDDDVVITIRRDRNGGRGCMWSVCWPGGDALFGGSASYGAAVRDIAGAIDTVPVRWETTTPAPDDGGYVRAHMHDLRFLPD